MYLLRNPIVGPRLSPSRYYRTQEVMPRWEQFCALEFSNETHAREAAALDSRGGKTVQVFFDNEVIGRYVDGADRHVPYHSEGQRYDALCPYCPHAGANGCGRIPRTQPQPPAAEDKAGAEER